MTTSFFPWKYWIKLAAGQTTSEVPLIIRRSASWMVCCFTRPPYRECSVEGHIRFGQTLLHRQCGTGLPKLERPPNHKIAGNPYSNCGRHCHEASKLFLEPAISWDYRYFSHYCSLSLPPLQAERDSDGCISLASGRVDISYRSRKSSDSALKHGMETTSCQMPSYLNTIDTVWAENLEYLTRGSALRKHDPLTDQSSPVIEQSIHLLLLLVALPSQHIGLIK